MPALVCGQDNPFATPNSGAANNGNANRSTATGRRAAPSLEEPKVAKNAPQTAQLLIRSVRASAPSSPRELAKAVQIMLDIRQYEHAAYYLARLDAATKDDAQRLALAEAIGSDFFLNLHASKELAPAGKAFSRRVLAAAHVQSQSPERITSLIGKLNDKNIAVRSSAFRQLRSIGPAAIATLVAIFADQTRAAEFPGIRGALNNMGPAALPLLQGAAHASDASVRVETLRALSHYPNPEVADVLAAAAVNPALPASIRESITVAILKSGRSLSDVTSLAGRLKEKSRALLAGKRRFSGGFSDTATVWTWDDTEKQLVPQQVTTSTAARIMAARYAADLFAIAPQQPDHRELYLLTQLDAAKRYVGSAQTVKRDAFVKSSGDVTAEELNRTLAAAIKLDTLQAAIASCELLAETGDESVFYSTGQPCPIVRAILSGDRHLQYAALNAIDKINPKTAYIGSSYAITLAVFLANTNQQSAGLVGHHRVETALRLAGSLSASGLRGKASHTSRDLFLQATSDPDINVVLISDTLDRPVFSELVRQLRSDFRTSRMPIALMIRDQRNQRRIQYLVTHDPLTRSISSAVDGELLNARIAQLVDVEDRGFSQLADEDRFKHAELAINWLAKVSLRNSNNRFYELGRYQSQISELIYRPGFATAASQILANLGTPRAQTELANFANQAGLPEEDRLTVASALSQSITEGATMLTNQQIKRQYDRYNNSQLESRETQQLLGSILDTIETRAAK